MMDLVSKIQNTKKLMLATRATFSATAKACLQLPERCRFIGCIKNFACFQNVPPSVMYLSARQILIADLDKTRGD